MHAEFKLKEDLTKPLRPFASLDEMNEIMIENHNKIVGDNDIVYHLGDFTFGGKQNIALFARRLKGRKRLILGNHDYNAKDYVEHFEKVSSCAEVEIAGTHFFMSHYPAYRSAFDARSNLKSYNLHGHTHDLLTGEKYHINVCVENIGFKPVAIEELTHGQPPVNRDYWSRNSTSVL